MRDYDLTDWCDFVRGLCPAEVEAEMRDRLARSPRARRDHAAMARVTRLAATDAELAVPAYALRAARAIGTLQRWGEAADAPPPRRRLLPFAVTFDSLLAPAPAGTRDLQAADRRLLFTAGDYTVDVRLEAEVDPPSAVMVGQLLERRDEVFAEPRPLAAVPVLVTSGGRIVGRAVTSAFGEFQLEGLPREALYLCLLVRDDAAIELPLAAT